MCSKPCTKRQAPAFEKQKHKGIITIILSWKIKASSMNMKEHKYIFSVEPVRSWNTLLVTTGSELDNS